MHSCWFSLEHYFTEPFFQEDILLGKAAYQENDCNESSQILLIKKKIPNTLKCFPS